MFYLKDKYLAHFIFIIAILKKERTYSSSGFTLFCLFIFSIFCAQTDIHFRLECSGPKASVMGPGYLQKGTLTFGRVGGT